jgi:hypothetical protein
MLSRPRLRIALGVVLFSILALGVGFAVGRTLIRHTHRHVVIDVFNVNSIAQIFVNCRQAARVRRDEPGATIDLGWLTPEDRVFLSATSRDPHPAFGFLASSNGRTFAEDSRGDSEILGFPAEPNAVVFAKAYLAGGTPLGQIGCQPPAVVAVPDYIESSDETGISRVKGNERPYRSPKTPYDQIDSIGDWSLIPLAVIGVSAAIAIGPARRLAWMHRKWVGGAIGLLTGLAALFFGVLGPSALLTTFTVSGTLLLFAVTIPLMLPPCWRRLERGADAGGL